MKGLIDLKELFKLFITFAKIGGITFGGGIAMLPMLERELVQKNGWTTENELLDYYAIGQCTPGIIAVNVATFVGYKRKGVVGSIFSTLGMIFFPLIIISIIAFFISNLLQYEIVGHFLNGVRVVVAAIICNAVISLAKKSIKSKSTLIVAIISFLLSFLLSFSPILLVIFSTIAGLFLVKGGEEK